MQALDSGSEGARGAGSNPAALTSKRVETGEEVLLSYGPFTAAGFLYQYGSPFGGADTPAVLTSQHDVVTLIPRALWPAPGVSARSSSHVTSSGKLSGSSRWSPSSNCTMCSSVSRL